MLIQRKAQILICYVLVLYQVQVSAESVITLVTRNVTDSFRVGEEGCKNKESICTSVEASCQDDGLCRCQQDYPNFRNPVITTGKIYGNSYGCIKDDQITSITLEIGHSSAVRCDFKPFKLLPADSNATDTIFEHKRTSFKECRLSSRYPSGMKYPSNNTFMEIDWLNETYVEIIVNGKYLDFKWKKSVPELQGLIVKIMLYCRESGGNWIHECFEGKVSGTWVRPVSKITSTPSSITNTMMSTIRIKPTSPSSTLSNQPTDVNQTVIFTTTPSSKKQDNTVIIVAAVGGVVVGAVLTLIIIVFVWYRQRKRNQGKNDQKDMSNPNMSSAYEYPMPQCDEVLNRGRNNRIYENQATMEPAYIEPSNQNISSENSNEPLSHYQALHRNNGDQDENTYQGLVLSQNE